MSEKPANKTEFRFGSGLTKYNLFSFLCESFRVSKGNTTLQTGTFFWAHANFPKVNVLGNVYKYTSKQISGSELELAQSYFARHSNTGRKAVGQTVKASGEKTFTGIFRSQIKGIFDLNIYWPFESNFYNALRLLDFHKIYKVNAQIYDYWYTDMHIDKIPAIEIKHINQLLEIVNGSKKYRRHEAMSGCMNGLRKMKLNVVDNVLKIDF